jgi:hypothetical protein
VAVGLQCLVLCVRNVTEHAERCKMLGWTAVGLFVCGGSGGAVGRGLLLLLLEL